MVPVWPNFVKLTIFWRTWAQKILSFQLQFVESSSKWRIFDEVRPQRPLQIWLCHFSSSSFRPKFVETTNFRRTSIQGQIRPKFVATTNFWRTWALCQNDELSTDLGIQGHFGPKVGRNDELSAKLRIQTNLGIQGHFGLSSSKVRQRNQNELNEFRANWGPKFQFSPNSFWIRPFDEFRTNWSLKALKATSALIRFEFVEPTRVESLFFGF